MGEYLATYQPKKNYADYVAAVQEVAPICGENGARAAFLQGHVEFLGLAWNGDWLAGANEGSDGNRSIPAPVHIQPGDVTTLAKATGLPPELIRKNNPGLGQAGNESKQLFLPGYHGHLTIVVGAQNQVETWAQIANQHNVSEDRLRAANLRGPNDPVPENTWLLVPDQEG